MKTKWLLVLALAACTGKSVIGSGDAIAPGTGGTVGSATVGSGGGAAMKVAAGTGGTPGTGRAPGAGGTLLIDTAGAAATADIMAAAGGETTAPGTCTTALVADNLRNYSLSGNLAIATTYVKPRTELTFDWSGVTRGLFGPIDAKTDIDVVDLGVVLSSANDVEAAVNDKSLEIGLHFLFDTQRGRTSAGLFDFTGPDDSTHIAHSTMLLYFDAGAAPPDRNSYLVELVKGGTPAGSGVEMVGLVALDETSENSEVVLNDGSATLFYESALPNSAVYSVPAGTPNLTVDFSAFTVDARGLKVERSFTGKSFGEVRIVQTSSRLTPDNQNKLLDLPVAHRWRAPLDDGGRDGLAGGPGFPEAIDLATLEDDDGNAFGGIDQSSTWFLELWDAEIVPAPSYLVVLTPCENPR